MASPIGYASNQFNSEYKDKRLVRRQIALRSQDDTSGNAVHGICDWNFTLTDCPKVYKLRLDQLIFPNTVYNVVNPADEPYGDFRNYQIGITVAGNTGAVGGTSIVKNILVTLPSGYYDQSTLNTQVASAIENAVAAAFPGMNPAFTITFTVLGIAGQANYLSRVSSNYPFLFTVGSIGPGYYVPSTGFPYSFMGTFLSMPLSSTSAIPTTNGAVGTAIINMAPLRSLSVMSRNIPQNAPYSFIQIGKLGGFIDEIPLEVPFGDIQVFTGSFTNLGTPIELDWPISLNNFNVSIANPDRPGYKAIDNNGIPVSMVFSVFVEESQ